MKIKNTVIEIRPADEVKNQAYVQCCSRRYPCPPQLFHQSTSLYLKLKILIITTLPPIFILRIRYDTQRVYQFSWH